MGDDVPVTGASGFVGGHFLKALEETGAVATAGYHRKQVKWIFYLDTRTIMDGTDRNVTYIDFIHYSPCGNRLVAESLVDFIERRRFIANYRKRQMEVNGEREGRREIDSSEVKSHWADQSIYG